MWFSELSVYGYGVCSTLPERGADVLWDIHDRTVFEMGARVCQYSADCTFLPIYLRLCTYLGAVGQRAWWPSTLLHVHITEFLLKFLLHTHQRQDQEVSEIGVRITQLTFTDTLTV